MRSGVKEKRIKALRWCGNKSTKVQPLQDVKLKNK